MSLDTYIAALAGALYLLAIYARHRSKRERSRRPGYITDQPKRRRPSA